MTTKHVFVIRAGLVIFLLAACSALKPPPTQPAQTPTAVVQPATGLKYHFVTNKLLIPTTQAQTREFALNVDGDPQQRSDNLFGELLNLLTSAAPGLELQATLDQAVNTGQLVTLHAGKADDPLNDPSVSWLIFQGQKTLSAPIFDGSDRFTPDSDAPANTPIVGSLINGHFAGGPGMARVQMFLLGQPVEMDLIGVRLEADVSVEGCANGKLGGGLTDVEFRSKLLPTIANGLTQIVNENTSVADTLLQVFDSDKDGTITTQELESNPVLMIAVSPDLDLLDAAGEFNPRQDGVKDSYSIGLGFTCVPAIFTALGD